jgi:hypothetical protein
MNETVDILREQIAELKQLLALKDQRINELSSRPQYPTIQPYYPPTIQPYNPPLYPQLGWPYTIITTSGNTISINSQQPQHNTIGYNQPININ